MMHILYVTTSSEEDREYFMPWYSDFYICETVEVLQRTKKQLMDSDDSLGEENFHEEYDLAVLR